MDPILSAVSTMTVCLGWPHTQKRPGCDGTRRSMALRSYPTSNEQLLLGAGGPRGATPHSRSGGAAVRRYPSSKVRSSGCGLLEQL